MACSLVLSLHDLYMAFQYQMPAESYGATMSTVDLKSATSSPTCRSSAIHTGRTFRVGISLALLALTGCATLDKEECVLGDWPAIGYKDGQRGLDAQKQFQRHTKACSKHNVAPDQTLYSEGFDQGLIVFCNPDSGYDHATGKKEYFGNCPAELENEFLESYIDGLLALIDDTDRDIDRYDDRKDDARVELAILRGRDNVAASTLKKARTNLSVAESQLSSARNDRRKYRRWLDRWRKKLRENN